MSWMRHLDPTPDERAVALGKPSDLRHRAERDPLQHWGNISSELLRVRLAAMLGIPLSELALPLCVPCTSQLVRLIRVSRILAYLPQRFQLRSSLLAECHRTGPGMQSSQWSRSRRSRITPHALQATGTIRSRVALHSSAFSALVRLWERAVNRVSTTSPRKLSM